MTERRTFKEGELVELKARGCNTRTVGITGWADGAIEVGADDDVDVKIVVPHAGYSTMKPPVEDERFTPKNIRPRGQPRIDDPFPVRPKVKAESLPQPLEDIKLRTMRCDRRVIVVATRPREFFQVTVRAEGIEEARVVQAVKAALKLLLEDED